MKFTHDSTSHCAGIILSDAPSARTHQLTDDVIAFTGADGALVDVELLDTRPFGDPFDEAAALRAIEWVRERIALDAVS